ncbi:methyltransferase domain-containing protein [Bradyrhizobium sp. 83012]|uniref:Methyltransferase domain-containing protein n=1 Tax=Bradyrhizobium aeschynomenes TaxID=2734909 RepID=A0ABX2CHG7_9BRAD|nr:class I SAM-dependent methyltransferase [Bradyrhizobium aeschynomenes]NPU67654.1 methyltransferase domain-containing protein [Bradyrhizobium aeschynomenes]
MTSTCCLCGSDIATPALSLGSVPVCNAFSKSGRADRRVDLDVVECETCRLIQLLQAPPPALLSPEVPWIRYREPEGHLDALVAGLTSLRPDARRAVGTGPFEQPLLSRLAAHGLHTQALSLDTTAADGRYPYLESWQATLGNEHLATVSAQHGTFDIVSCRYIVEHSPTPVAALQALKQLLSPDGVLLIEVPDSSKFLAARDYCFLWEEHSCYFVEDTLRQLAHASGYQVLALLRYPGALEDALVAVLAPGHVTAPSPAQGPSTLFETYRSSFPEQRALVQARLRAGAGPRRDGLALFGIGHHAIMFANAFGVADLIALAVDDDADKRGFFPPGLRVPVVGSEQLLVDERITTCLFAVAPHIEGRVRDKLAPLAARGVAFHSIYAALDNAITKDLA